MAQSLKTRLKPRNGYKIVTKEELMLPKTFVPNWPDKLRRNTSTCELSLTKVAQSLKTRLKPRNGYKIVTKEELMLPKTFVPQWPDKRRRNTGTRIASDLNQEHFKLILSLRPFAIAEFVIETHYSYFPRMPEVSALFRFGPKRFRPFPVSALEVSAQYKKFSIFLINMYKI